jgi:outer membrane protein assembly factor BamB
MRIAMLGGAIVIGAAAMAAAPPDDNWRLWGGPQRDFIAAGRSQPPSAQKWLATPPKKLWERPLGDGYSAIAVEDGVLYTAYRHDARDVVIALDAATGKTLWEHGYDAPFKNAYAERVGPGPYAMPQVVGDRLVTASGVGQIHSLEKRTGRPVWSWDLYKNAAGNPLEFGYSSHPLPYKDSLIVVAGGRKSGVLRLRQTDGTAVWQKLKLQNAHSSPLLIDVDGQQQVAILLADEIVGIDPESGDLLWRHPHKTQNGLAISTPVWAPGNLLFLSTAYEGGARVLKLTRSGNATTVQELWHNPRVQLHFGSAIRHGDHVYVSSGQSVGLLTGVHLPTGRVTWQVRDFVKAQLLSDSGRLIILDEDGNLGLGLASPERFQALAKWPILKSLAWTPPTLAGNRLYLRDRRVIMALDFGSAR